MSHTPISVFIITLNEEKYLNQVLENLRNFDEIILVDSGSTDNTVEIAKQYGAKVYHQDWLGFAKQKSYAMSLCRNDWVLNVDGDEILSSEFVSRIQSVVDEKSADAYRLYFEDIFWQLPMSANSKKRSIVRLYNKHKVQFPTDRLVHENVKVSKSAKQQDMSGLVIHYGYQSTEVLMEKQNKYSSLKAQEKFNKGKKPSWLKLFLVFPLMFVKAYFIERMFLSGRRGLVHAYISAMYGFLKEAKLHELHFVNKNNRKK
ncbi:glycosyltransferase family 2 protein [Aliiglaciecola sp. NS0011-25]|uniref:glycosyltransferase family 2 protein n=1 Tax=Aliiglaciecola sp. NS0011-25 TaxID=3127654 RepID=UPI0031090DB5